MRILFVLLLFPVFIFGQSNSGTVKLRKNKPHEAFVTVGGIFEGIISKSKLLKNPRLALHSSKEGEILSFVFCTVSDGTYISLKNNGSEFSKKTIALIEKRSFTFKKVFIEKIVARIGNDTVRTNSIDLEIGKVSSRAVDLDKVVTTLFLAKTEMLISKSNPSEIREVCGLWKGRIIKPKSFVMGVTTQGIYNETKVTSEEGYKRIIDFIKGYYINSRLYITNITYQTSSEELKGTPIVLKVTH